MSIINIILEKYDLSLKQKRSSTLQLRYNRKIGYCNFMSCNKRNASIWKADFSDEGNWLLNIVAISRRNSRKTLPVIIKRNLTGWKGTLTFIKIFHRVSSCTRSTRGKSFIDEWSRRELVCHLVHKISKLDLCCMIGEKIIRLVSALNTITNRKNWLSAALSCINHPLRAPILMHINVVLSINLGSE